MITESIKGQFNSDTGMDLGVSIRANSSNESCRLELLASEYNILTKRNELDTEAVYNSILAYSNRRQFILLESNKTIYVSAYQEICDTKKRLLGGEYIFSVLDKKPSCDLYGKGIPCIYFLFNNGALVYIGQTKNLLSRISCHSDNKGKAFDEICSFRVHSNILTLVEFLNINFYKPILNCTGKDSLSFLNTVLENCCFE